MLRSSWRGLDGLPASSAWRVRGARRGTSVVRACSASFRWIRASTRPGAIHWVGGHTLRHTFATQSLLNGVPLRVVSRSLGHSSIAITADTYGHLTDDAAASAVAKVAEAFGV
ncbi:tyrosine-type recombinase/integrase [Dermacoccus nishinomiyaensis]|uniref:tyrosine-type recombinase/integrase n=1 Tax=Dermacoccus TaxID=57495 RepID=UPI0009E032FF